MEKPDSLKQFADRIHDVGEIQVAGGYLVQHGRKQEKVLAINKCDLEVRVTGHRLLQLERGVQPAEAPAQYQNPYWPVRTHQTSLRSAKTEKRPSRSSECLQVRAWRKPGRLIVLLRLQLGPVFVGLLTISFGVLGEHHVSFFITLKE